MPRPPKFPKRKLLNSVKLAPQQNQVTALVIQGLSLHQQGSLNEAEAIYKRVLVIQGNHFDALQLIGALFVQTQQFKKAVDFLTRALRVNPNFAEAHSNLGNALVELKCLDKALESYDKAIRLKPDFADAYAKRGNTLVELKRFDEALENYDKAIHLKPDFAEAYSNRGLALVELKRLDEALESCNKAIRLKPDFADAYSNRGNALLELKRFDEALESYDKAIRLKSDFAEAYSNRGNALVELKRLDEALESCEKAIRLQPDFAEAYSNRGNALEELNRFDEAFESYDKAIRLKPDIDWICGGSLHIKMKICCWLGLTDSLDYISKKVVASEKVINPFPLIALTDDALLQKKSSEIYTQFGYPINTALGEIPKRAKKEKIRIAYFSPDFQNHPVSILSAELFEIHDRQHFEVFAFSMRKAPIGDVMYLRLKNGFDQFINVDSMSDLEIAQLTRELGVDIAIDLAGLTQYSRTGIFSYRAAPIQVNYLGYCGTLGADYIDYIIADKTLIPPDSQSFYLEKAVYLPNSYQVNDRKRLISDRQFTRQELGLPENSFVYCCFNNNYKILPATFYGWMRILKAVEGSVLWLFQDNPWVVDNLKSEALNHGVEANRLVFAERMPLSEHLARHRLADLFLDTFPCNAGTTASDALWAGLPVLSLMGRSFVSRMAASILNAIRLPELITNTQEEYEALAIDLATNPEKLAAIKLKLANNRLTTPLFDTPLFVKHLEAAYTQMMDRYWNDNPPENIYIEI